MRLPHSSTESARPPVANPTTLGLFLRRFYRSLCSGRSFIKRLFVRQQRQFWWLVLLFACAESTLARDWNPGPGWRDSYAVDGVCYCDSSNYDHGIGDILISAPDGYQRTVKQVCADILRVFGRGPEQNRIPYNTIACGNGPPNDMPDEDLLSGCPGRVDKGKAGCFEIGPEWPLEIVYGDPIQQLDRTLWQLNSSDNPAALAAATDRDTATRWSTNKPQASGQWLQVDFGSLQAVNRIILLTTVSPNDFPRGWQVDISIDGQVWHPVTSGVADSAAQVIADKPANAPVRVDSGSVAGEVTTIAFDMRLARHLKITQTRNINHWYWSVHELYAGVAD